jgi:hypothetical protein
LNAGQVYLLLQRFLIGNVLYLACVNGIPYPSTIRSPTNPNAARILFSFPRACRRSPATWLSPSPDPANASAERADSF